MDEADRALPGQGIPQDLFALVYKVERRIRPHFRGTGMHWGLRRILQRLWIEDGLSQAELAKRTGSSEASISNMLKHLVAQGWVERRQDEYDYRISRIYLSPRGHALGREIAGELESLDSRVRGVLGEESAMAFQSVLVRLGGDLAADDAGDVERLCKDTPSPPGDL